MRTARVTVCHARSLKPATARALSELAGTVARASFRFDCLKHEYFLGGELVPGITSMLIKTGHVDPRWYTDEGKRRGTAVHDLTADFDYGILDVANFESEYRGYVLAYVAAMRVIRPTWIDIEQTACHRGFKFGGKPDRSGSILDKAAAVVELKTGAPEKSHSIQTALQGILKAPAFHLPERMIGRFAIYLTGRGKFHVEEHKDQTDFDKAFEVIRECCL